MPRAQTKRPLPFPLPIDELAGHDDTLPACDDLDETEHRYERDDLHAINAAIAAERPLLLRGEPGTGKSQLARAAAHLLNRRYRWKVVDAHTEVSDLFYTFDAVARLAYAQIIGAVDRPQTVEERKRVLEDLAVGHFLRPGPLWWAFDEATASAQENEYIKRCGSNRPITPPLAAQAQGDPRRGWVILIDEIDKADPSVPNGLLEALGQGTFEVPGGNTITLHKPGAAYTDKPLVIITTNEERELPSAFVRRCMVRRIDLPDDKSDPTRSKLHNWLIERGTTHFPSAPKPVLETAATMLIGDRIAAQDLGVTAPGQAEFLDLVRAVLRLDTDMKAQLDLLKSIGNFALKKHPDQVISKERR